MLDVFGSSSLLCWADCFFGLFADFSLLLLISILSVGSVNAIKLSVGYSFRFSEVLIGLWPVGTYSFWFVFVLMRWPVREPLEPPDPPLERVRSLRELRKFLEPLLALWRMSAADYPSLPAFLSITLLVSSLHESPSSSSTWIALRI